ncbi:862_t:CDS:2 [Cetraspora pellucida]|uniref:862_t:CDS:1 n=1 Tax=Cetraspora pellucida TaxID=1433469 RepID=A0ACA9KMC1_9GLOM|nr:862_t:CDS:2 [Cetraspora pellucida]
MVNNVNAQQYINEKYSINGVCKSSSDEENKGKRREEITELDLSKGKVGKGFFNDGKTLTGSLKLEGFTKLRKLIISSQQITELDVSECENLTELDCQNNQVDKLNVSNCSNLKKINCSNNHIKGLDLSFCPDLEEVNINNCPGLTPDKIKSDLYHDTDNGKLVKNNFQKLTKTGPQISKATNNDIRNILIVGWTGNGKSTLANTLIGTAKFEEKGSGVSVTKTFQKSEIFEVGEGIYSAKEGISQILFVVKGRFAENQIIAFNMFKDFIAETGITKFATVVRTGFKDFRSADKCVKDQEELLTQRKEIEEIINSCNGIIHVDNPSIPDRDEEDSDNEQEILISEKKRKESREKEKELEKGDSSIKKEDLSQAKGELVQKVDKTIKGNFGISIPVIILVGKTGSGKSTLANVISNTNKFQESGSTSSGTREIQSEEFKENEVSCQVIDTVGIGDTQLAKEKVLDKIAEAVYLARNGISRVLFVTDGRFDPYEMSIYNLLKTIIFDERVTKHTTIIRTNFNDFGKQKKCETDIESMIESGSDELAKIIKTCREKIIHAKIESKKKLAKKEEERRKKQEEAKKKEEIKKAVKQISTAEELKNELENVSSAETEDSETKSVTKKEEQPTENDQDLESNRKIFTKLRIATLESELKELEETKKLIEEIQVAEGVIRQKVLNHIFHNYDEITQVAGGDIFINSIVGDNTNPLNTSKLSLAELQKQKEKLEEKLLEKKDDDQSLDEIKNKINQKEQELLKLKKELLDIKEIFEE